MGNTLQLIRYRHQYGRENVCKVLLEEDGSFHIAVRTGNKGRVQQDLDAGNCFLWQDRLIWTNRN